MNKNDKDTATLDTEANLPDKLGGPSLPTGIDPFAAREGHMLEWSQLQLETKAGGKNNKKPTEILKKVSGCAKPGELTCIMGASGSGKTSLLQTLSGRSSSQSYDLQGRIYMDGIQIDPSSQKLQKRIAYIAQSDRLLPTATPREAIRFAARLRLPRETTEAEICLLTNRILQELRLTDVADSLIGGDLVKSLSGGEMRRVSLGVQLVVKPRVLFLDEITSGLDSRNAGVVMDVCKNVAKAGTTMIIVIHQPSSNIFAMMDQLVLLDHGRTMYQGPASRAMDYFAAKGHPVPDNYNPADWLVQVTLDVPQEELFRSGFFSEELTDKDDEDSMDMTQTSIRTTGSIAVAMDEKQRATTLTQTLELLGRERKNLARDGNGLLLRTLCVGASSLLTAISFTNVGESSL